MQTERDNTGFARSFGLWKRKAANGLQYQERLRAEWKVEKVTGSRFRANAHSCDETA
jgi:hypothetical protein